MNCETYLSMLSTLPIDELTHGDARAHVATCRDCDRVSRVVAERERNMLMAFGELYPPTPTDPIATRALEISRRRRIGLYYKMGLGLAMGATLFSMFVVRRTVPNSNVRISDTFLLRCLSPEQAAAIIQPIPVNATGVGDDSQVGIINVTGSPAELARVQAVLNKNDDPAVVTCGIKQTVRAGTKSP